MTCPGWRSRSRRTQSPCPRRRGGGRRTWRPSGRPSGICCGLPESAGCSCCTPPTPSRCWGSRPPPRHRSPRTPWPSPSHAGTASQHSKSHSLKTPRPPRPRAQPRWGGACARGVCGMWIPGTCRRRPRPCMPQPPWGTPLCPLPEYTTPAPGGRHLLPCCLGEEARLTRSIPGKSKVRGRVDARVSVLSNERSANLERCACEAPKTAATSNAQT
mmetsp:Transcript_14750/g.33589  ORF Transcript_14750/g.33589 Transcript_14750/m.33589 type:complete len:215 (+) Transcript_14750:529-1173(+)